MKQCGPIAQIVSEFLNVKKKIEYTKLNVSYARTNFQFIPIYESSAQFRVFKGLYLGALH